MIYFGDDYLKIYPFDPTKPKKFQELEIGPD